MGCPDHRWTPDPVYEARRKKEGFSTPVKRTGKLRKDLTRSKPIRLTKTSVSVGTKLPYARAVHFRKPNGYLLTGFSASMKSATQKVLQAHIVKIMREIVMRTEKGIL